MITLQSISPAEYKTWLTQAIREYADDKVGAGNWVAAEALDSSCAALTSDCVLDSAADGQGHPSKTAQHGTSNDTG